MWSAVSYAKYIHGCRRYTCASCAARAKPVYRCRSVAEEALLVLLCATVTPALLERITVKCENAASHHSNSRNNTQDCNIQHACITAPNKLFDADGTCPAVRAAQFETSA